MGREAAGAGIPAAGIGALGRALVFSSSRRFVASSEKMWVASSREDSASPRLRRPSRHRRRWRLARAPERVWVSSPVAARRPGEAMRVPRRRRGKPRRAQKVGAESPARDGIAAGAVMPSRVRFPTSGPRSEGGGGGTLRPGREGAPFFPRSSKMSRSAPPFSFCAIARVS